MRITLSSAMRARDVSRPTDEQLAAAAEREARVTRPIRPGSASAAREPGSASAARGPGSATPAGPARTGPDKPSAATAPSRQRDAGNAGRGDKGRGDAVSPPTAADKAPSPKRRRRRRRAR
jgi:hypothetical protein